LNYKVLVGVEVHVASLDVVKISAMNMKPHTISEHSGMVSGETDRLALRRWGSRDTSRYELQAEYSIVNTQWRPRSKLCSSCVTAVSVLCVPMIAQQHVDKDR
jgi:hypothetical protein